MFQPCIPGVRRYVLKNNGLVIAYNQHDNVVDVWHPNGATNVLERNYDENLTIAELTLDQVVEVAVGLAGYISEQLKPNIRSTPFQAGYMAEVERDVADRAFNRVAYGGKRAQEWVESPVERGPPVSVLGVQALVIVCKELDEQHPAQRLSVDHRMLLALLFFGEFVFPTQVE